MAANRARSAERGVRRRGIEAVPLAAATGPTMQVAVGSTIGVATGRAGSVVGVLVVCHAHAGGSVAVPASVRSVTLNGESTK